MNEVANTSLARRRLQKAMDLITQLRDSYKELESRYRMVETHNLELQELMDKVSADQNVVEEAIASALDSLESLGELESFGTLDLGEIEEAEAFTMDSSFEDFGEFESGEEEF